MGLKIKIALMIAVLIVSYLVVLFGSLGNELIGNSDNLEIENTATITKDTLPILFQYPPQSGTYEKDGWKYILNIRLRGTRSEKRTSKLLYDGQEYIGNHGDTISCPLGKFMFFSDKSSLGIYGWHNQGKFDKPIINSYGYFKNDILKKVLFYRRQADSLSNLKDPN